MAHVLFTRWATDRSYRVPVTVNPARVDCVEHISDAAEVTDVQAAIWTSDVNCRKATIPAAAKIIMQGKQEYYVQGTVAEVTEALNAGKVKGG